MSKRLSSFNHSTYIQIDSLNTIAPRCTLNGSLVCDSDLLSSSIRGVEGAFNMVRLNMHDTVPITPGKSCDGDIGYI